MKTATSKLCVIVGALTLSTVALPVAARPKNATPVATTATNQMFARRILADPNLDDVLNRARTLLKSGFNAGSGYPEVWIRDFATFMEISCQVNDHAAIRNGLLMILRFQREDGNIPDGVGQQTPPANTTIEEADPSRGTPTPHLTTEITIGREIIRNPLVLDHVAFKNSVETDQETSLIQAVATYIRVTGDSSILREVIFGRTVLNRMEGALDFLLQHRYASKYGLIWGGTTIDWGDIAPEDRIGAVVTPQTHRAIDIYDNAMLLLAIRDYLPFIRDNAVLTRKWQRVERDIRANSRKYLWDGSRQKFIPHIYLDGSPFPKIFDESAVWYHGGTFVAIQAGLLTHDEIVVSLQAIRLNVHQAGGLTLGETNYPVYPKGTFLNPNVNPNVYQNGGDWDWFGGRGVQALISQGFAPDAYLELIPMIQRVQRHNGFYEWFDKQDHPQGSATFRGSAGVLGKAILMMQGWAKTQTAASQTSH